MNFLVKIAMKNAQSWMALQKTIMSPKHGKVSVRAGVIGELAQKEHNDSDISTGLLAAYMEYGTATIPPRSLVKTPFKKNEAKYRQMLRTGFKPIAEGLTAEQVLAPIGEFMAKDMQAAVREGIPPPNAPSTIARKESTTPLIETTVLVESISSEVVK